jgi:hypothetical protein
MSTIRFYECMARFGDWVTRTARERAFKARITENNERNGYRHLGAVILFVCFAAPACVPRHVERSIASELRRCEAAINAAAPEDVEAERQRCHANLRRIER